MVKSFPAEDVRRGLSDMINDALAGHEIIIERYRKPLAVIIGHEEWVELKRRIVELETLSEARRILRETPDDAWISQQELDQMIAEKAERVAA